VIADITRYLAPLFTPAVITIDFPHDSEGEARHFYKTGDSKFNATRTQKQRLEI